MKKTFNVDAGLLKEAKAACNAATDTETIRLGLDALVRHAAYERLRRDTERGRESVLDDYGAESPAEFFAVAKKLMGLATAAADAASDVMELR